MLRSLFALMLTLPALPSTLELPVSGTRTFLSGDFNTYSDVLVEYSIAASNSTNALVEYVYSFATIEPGVIEVLTISVDAGCTFLDCVQGLTILNGEGSAVIGDWTDVPGSIFGLRLFLPSGSNAVQFSFRSNRLPRWGDVFGRTQDFTRFFYNDGFGSDFNSGFDDPIRFIPVPGSGLQPSAIPEPGGMGFTMGGCLVFMLLRARGKKKRSQQAK
jgi:hypothetical protein